MKHMGIINGALAESYLLKGLSSKIQNETAAFYYERSVRHYEEALDANPTNLTYMKHCAHALERQVRCQELAQRTHNQIMDAYSMTNPLVLKIVTLMKRILILDPRCCFTLRNYAKLLDKCRERCQAQDLYLQALEADPSHYEAYLGYSGFLGSEARMTADEHTKRILEGKGIELERLYCKFAEHSHNSILTKEDWKDLKSSV